jgi:type I restriction enzyme, S subunit
MDERLPEGWVSAKLGDIVFPGDARHPNKSTEPDFLYVDIEALDNTLQKIVAPKKIPSSEAPGRARLVIHTDDIIFSLTRPYLKNIAIVPPELDDQIASTAYCVMRPETGISSHFIYYLITRDDFIDSIITYGDSPPAAHDDEFLAMKIPLAPTNEQHRIVGAIEQQFTRLDNAVASLQSAKARAKQYRASLLKAAAEGELTKEWRAEHAVEETGAQLLARILAERHTRWEEEQLAKMREKGKVPRNDEWKNHYKEPQGPNVEKLPEPPEGWCWATVEQVNYFVRYGSSAKTSNDSNGVPVLRMGNIQDGVLDFNNLKYLPVDHSEFPELFLEKGDLLFNRTNSAELVGKSAIYRGEFPQCSYASYLICVRLVVDHLADFLCHYINSHYGRVWINSVYTQQAGQANVNGSKLQALAFPFPPLAEQAQIVAEIEAQFSELAKTEEAIEHSLRRAEQERQSILREAFAGRLAEQNPEDEPVGVLLGRIREEREKREADEKERRKEARKMINPRKPRTFKNDWERIYYTLAGVETALKPEEVFIRGGFKVDEQPESVEAFQVALTLLEEAGAVLEERPDDSTVTLRAVEMPVEQIQALLGLVADEQEDAEDTSDVSEPEQAYKQLSFLDKENREP